jgi:predicted DNA-binding protein (UPF0251 family)
MRIRVIQQAEPATFVFQPIGDDQDRKDIINLTFEELEAISLVNLKELAQRDAADNMHISQPTFNRLLSSAYKKIAHFLVNGKKLMIQGGNYMMAQEERRFLCYDCRAEFGAPYGTPRPNKCPQCGSTNIHRHPDDTGARYRGGRGMGGAGGRGAGRGGGRGRGQGMYGPNRG